MISSHAVWLYCRFPLSVRLVEEILLERGIVLSYETMLCIKLCGLLTADQAAKVDATKTDWPEFATVRRLAMQFRSMLKSKSVGKLGAWLRDAQKLGLYAMQRFSRTLQRDIDAVRNAITEPWNNGQTGGQINCLKALKRTMWG